MKKIERYLREFVHVSSQIAHAVKARLRKHLPLHKMIISEDDFDVREHTHICE